MTQSFKISHNSIQFDILHLIKVQTFNIEYLISITISIHEYSIKYEIDNANKLSQVQIVV